MKSLKDIQNHAEEIAAKLKAGQAITEDELKVLQIFNSLSGGKSWRAGKRKKKN